MVATNWWTFNCGERETSGILGGLNTYETMSYSYYVRSILLFLKELCGLEKGCYVEKNAECRRGNQSSMNKHVGQGYSTQ